MQNTIFCEMLKQSEAKSNKNALENMPLFYIIKCDPDSDKHLYAIYYLLFMLF